MATTVSVVILNYNGKEFLRRVVESALAQAWRPLEVIVVDNASTDGSADEIAAAFGSRVQLLRRSKNSATAGRNDGFRAAHGEFILSIDDDIVVPDPAMMEQAVAIFESFPRVGALACRVGTEESPRSFNPEHWWHPVPLTAGQDRYFYSDYVSEGAVFLRRQAVMASGGYDEDFFWGFEAIDFAFGILKAGYDILYCPDLVTAELRVRGFSEHGRAIINYYSLRNRLWTVWKHYPVWKGLVYATGRLGIAAVRAVSRGWPDYFARAVKDGVFAPANIRAKRQPLSTEVWRRIAELRRGKFVDVMQQGLAGATEAPAKTSVS